MKKEEYNKLFTEYPTRVTIHLLIIGLTIFVGVFAVNQVMMYYYNSELLQRPCELCAELNPDVKKCFEPARTVLVDDKNKINVSDIQINFSLANP